jgi:WD40 repeat protein
MSVVLVAFSHDSAWLASGSDDNTIKIWDVSSGECLQTLEGHIDGVNSVSFSQDSTRLASTSLYDVVEIRDVNSGECLQTLKGHSNTVNSVTFSPSSALLASASDDKTVKIWDADSGECLQTLKSDRVLNNISFDTTGSYLYTEVGAIAITAKTIATSAAPTVTKRQNIRHHGMGLSLDNAWITYNSENLVWLPIEYRPSCTAVSGKRIVLGCISGEVWICSIDLEKSSELGEYLYGGDQLPESF